MKPQVKNRFLRTALCCLLVLSGALLPSSAHAAFVPKPVASINSYSYVRLTWSQSSSATYGYYIRRSTSSSYASSVALARVTSKSTTTYCDYSAIPGKKYYYWVCPIYRRSGSTYYSYYSSSRYDWGQRLVYVPKPTASINNYNYVRVTWPQSSNATYGYYIRRGTSSNYSSSISLARATSKSTTAYNDYSAVPGKTYYYWVCPIYRKVGSTYYFVYNTSRWDWGRRLSSVPTPVATICYFDYIKLTWSQSSSATYGYYIRRGTSSSYSSSVALTRVASKSTTTYYDRTAKRGTKYYYWVCPIYRKVGSTNYFVYNTSRWDWGIRPYVYCTASYSGYARLSWCALSSATYGYEIRRGTSSSYSSSIHLARVSTSTRSYTDRSGTAGKIYYYWVCPIYSSTSSAYYWYYNTSWRDWGRRY